MNTVSMRNAVLTVAMATCVAAPEVLAQRSSLEAAANVPAPSANSRQHAGAPADADAGDKGRSGFGQVMQLLTQLLQDAADKQATAAPADALVAAEDDSSAAVSIRVTPVEGRSSFYTPKVDTRRASRSAAEAAGPADKFAVQAGSAD